VINVLLFTLTPYPFNEFLLRKYLFELLPTAYLPRLDHLPLRPILSIPGDSFQRIGTSLKVFLALRFIDGYLLLDNFILGLYQYLCCPLQLLLSSELFALIVDLPHGFQEVEIEL
jgi:hypothetical protein